MQKAITASFKFIVSQTIFFDLNWKMYDEEELELADELFNTSKNNLKQAKWNLDLNNENDSKKRKRKQKPAWEDDDVMFT
jgi:hypothetical protein